MQTMFCYQCEQTAKGIGCTLSGVCGKTPQVAILQDLLIYTLKNLSVLATEARKYNLPLNDINLFIAAGLFATVTNVDFDKQRIAELIRRSVAHCDNLRALLREKISLDTLPTATKFKLANSVDEMIEQGKIHNVIDDQETNPDIQSLKSMALFGIKGIAAYADHAAILGEQDEQIYTFMQTALANMLRYDLSMEQWLALVMQCGAINLLTMKLLDTAHRKHYGTPTPNQVPLGAKRGKAILISGHDLRDLELLLQQTQDKNIFIYTHGEMLPSHAYPKLKKYPHFYGHYGTAWQNQHKEFEAFPGAILMTTNCLQKPLETYHDRIFTTGLVAWPEITHIGADKNFTPVINKALSLNGYSEDQNGNHVTVGFGHDTVFKIAPQIIKLVNAGKIRHFFLVGGCDGAKLGRNYYTDFVSQVPSDCIVLTLACGKFRFFTQKMGDIEGIPRLLDVGQCNDAYSAVQIALALAKAFNVGVNQLPLTFILSWYEQKAVAILLTLLSLGVKNIRLGPSLPAFITPNVLQLLVKQFNIQSTSIAENDLKSSLQEEAVQKMQENN